MLLVGGANYSIELARNRLGSDIIILPQGTNVSSQPFYTLFYTPSGSYLPQATLGTIGGVQGVKDANALVRGTWGAAPADGLEPQDGDHVVEKMRMNGFYETRLDILLRGLGVETLIISGAWTNMSIEHTARHAADAGYRAIVPSDGTSTVNDEWQNVALNYAMQNVASVGTCAEIADALNA